MSDEPSFIGAEDFVGGNFDKLSFRLIILEHLRKVAGLSCVEFRGGYWQTKIRVVKNQSFTEKIYTPDSRDIFANSIYVLSDLLYHHFDQKMLDAEIKINSDLEELRSKYESLIKNSQDNHTFLKEIFAKKKLLLIRQLFRELSSFLARVNYLELHHAEE